MSSSKPRFMWSRSVSPRNACLPARSMVSVIFVAGRSSGASASRMHGAGCGVDLVVMRGPGFGLLHAGHLAPLVGDAGGPDFLLVDGGEKFDVLERHGLRRGGRERMRGADGVARIQDVGQRADARAG